MKTETECTGGHRRRPEADGHDFKLVEAEMQTASEPHE